MASLDGMKRLLICGKKARIFWVALGLVALLFYHKRVSLHTHRDLTPNHQSHGTTGYKNIHQWESSYQQASPQYPQQTSHKSCYPTCRFIIGLNFWEQLTMATKNLMHLMCLGESWNARTIEPFTFNSRLYGLRTFRADENNKTAGSAQNLDLIFNMDSFHKVIEDFELPRLVNFHDFLRYSTREVVVLHFIPLKEVHEIPVMIGNTGKRLSAALQVNSVVDCMYLLRDYRINLTTALNAELPGSKPQFTIVRYLCVNMSRLTTPKELAFQAAINMNGSLTVLAVNWRGTSQSKMIQRTAAGSHLNNRVAMKSSCKAAGKLINHRPIMHSDRVRETARRFAKTIGIGHGVKYIGVHIRSEKLGLRDNHVPNTSSTCIHKALTTKDELLAKEKTHNISVVYTTDYGPYSSDTCRNCRGGRRVMRMLSGSGMKEIKFNPSLFSLPVDSGFVAAVESELLASANTLILVGGGSFQNHIGKLFLEYNNSSGNHNRLFEVCTTEKSTKKVLKQSSGNH